MGMPKSVNRPEPLLRVLKATSRSAARPTDAETTAALAHKYRTLRGASLQLVDHLSPEDQCIQSMADSSPIKWHLAHTTWFFETLVLKAHLPGYRDFDPRFGYLFNSYYEALGSRHARPQRGMLTRPSLAEVNAYREHVDRAAHSMLDRGSLSSEVNWLIELGLNHEQQHQELMLTDIKHAFWLNPLRPAVRMPGCGRSEASKAPTSPMTWQRSLGGVRQIGHHGNAFAFDNETPRHAVLLQPFSLASRLVTNAEYVDFIRDGGYRDPRWWLSDGWGCVQSQGWTAPLYWEVVDEGRVGGRASAPGGRIDDYRIFTLDGMRDPDPDQAVTHLSYYEASAFASWAGARLPTEFEWEAAAESWSGVEPICADAWQWTRSSYDPYPGYKPWAGLAGEYNGKFMVGQQVLRGGSFATPSGHLRITYRNFFPPGARWQFSGLRLARDA
jgi:ergothioneine biosynthesis protein EgtB